MKTAVIMDCQTLVSRIIELEPAASLDRIARLSAVMAQLVDAPDQLADQETLVEVWRNASLKMKVAADQTAAVSEELERLAQSEPAQFSPEHIWTLIRAIKVLSQSLHLYSGEPVLDV